MIGKILQATLTTLRYIISGRGRELLEVVGLAGQRWQQWELQFRDLEDRFPKIPFRRLRQHFVVSLSRKDPSDPEKLKVLAREYLERMGYGGQPYAVAYHTHSKTPHLHIVTTRAKADGTLVSDSFSGYKSRRSCLAIEKAHGLVQTPEAGEGTRSYSRQDYEAWRKGEITPQVAVRQAIEAVMAPAAQAKRQVPLEELRQHLSEAGIQLETRTTKDGRVIGLSYVVGEQRISGSRLPGLYGWRNMRKQLDLTPRLEVEVAPEIEAEEGPDLPQFDPDAPGMADLGLGLDQGGPERKR